MSYLPPSEFVTQMVDSGESKVYMSTKDTVIRAFMAVLYLGWLQPLPLQSLYKQAHR